MLSIRWVLNIRLFPTPNSPFVNFIEPISSEVPPTPLAISSQFLLPAPSLQNTEASRIPKGSVLASFSSL